MNYHLMRPLRNPMKCGDMAVLTDIVMTADGFIKGSTIIKGEIVELKWDSNGNVLYQDDDYSLETTHEHFEIIKSYLNCIIH